SITSITPNHGPIVGNTIVDIRGANFDPQASVKFGDADGLNIQVISSTEIKVTTPTAAAGAVDVKVKNPNLPATITPAGFIYDAPQAPTITSITPNHGPVAGNT